jgi:drug/metabolite transporter (DMT)-like permease
MLGSALCFTVMGIFVHESARQGIPPAEITFVRFAFGLGTLVLLSLSGRIRIRVGNPKLLMARGGFGAVAILFFHSALSRTSLSNANLLNQTCTLWSALFAYLFLQEHANLKTMASLVLAAAGVALVTGGNFLHLSAGDTYGVISGLCGGAAITIIRQLRRSGGESAWSVFFFLCAVGAPLAGVLMLRDAQVPSVRALTPLLLVAIAGTAAQLLLTYSYKYLPTARAGTLSLSNVALYAWAGYALFGESLTPGGIAGSLLVLASCVYVASQQA